MRRVAFFLLVILTSCTAVGRDDDEVRLPMFRGGGTFVSASPPFETSAILTFDRWGNPIGASAPVLDDGSGRIVLRADGRAPVGSVLARGWPSGTASCYLAGRRPDGVMDLLRLAGAGGSEGQQQGLGGPVAPEDLCLTFGREGVVVLRIVRSGEGITYSWGHLHEFTDDSRWDEGVVTLSSSEVESSASGILLDGLGATFRRRADLRKTPWTIVLLEFSDDVRVVDLFRAVESTLGCDGVQFEPPIEIIQPQIELVRLPIPSEEDKALLEEVGGEMLTLNILPPRGDEPGGCWLRGRYVSPEHIPFRSGSTLLRIDEEAPWRLVQPIIALALRNESDILFGIRREARGFRHERAFRVPLANKIDVSEVRLSDACAPMDFMQRPEVRLVVPEGAKAGNVVRMTLCLLRRGTRGLSYEIRN